MILISASFFFNKLNGQNVIAPINENHGDYNILYNKIVKNTTTYHIFKRLEKKTLTEKNDYLINLFNDNFLACPIPEKGMVYSIVINKVDFNDVNIDSSYSFYSYNFSTLGYKYYIESDGKVTVETKLGSPPNTPVNPNYFLSDPLERNGIIAIKRKHHFILSFLFLSGEMFLDDVRKRIFNGNINEQNVTTYIQMKYYNYQPDILQNDFKKDKSVIFYSKILEKKFRVYINRNGNDVIKKT